MTDADTCPCCGSPVRVVSDKEGTNSYEPLVDAQIATLAGALQRVLPYAAAYDPAEYGGKEPSQDEDIALARTVLADIPAAAREMLEEREGLRLALFSAVLFLEGAFPAPDPLLRAELNSYRAVLKEPPC